MALTKTILFRCAALFLGCILLFAGAWLGYSWRQNTRAQMRTQALPLTVQAAKPLIGAIERYKQERGAAPATLKFLVPKYLAKIPGAGVAAKDGGWRYNAKAKNEAGGWALWIRVRDEYSPNLVGFGDSFVFHPSRRYAPTDYGGGLLKQFEGWAYYVE